MQGIKPLLLILLLTFLVEILLSNRLRLIIPENTHQVLTRDVCVSEGEVYRSEEFSIQDTVKNVYIAMPDDVSQVCEVTILLTDEGDKYPYSLPAQKVFSEVPDTQSIAIYPFGKVNTLQLEMKAPEGSTVTISSLEVNRKPAWEFRFPRFLVLFLLSAGLYFADRWLSGERKEKFASENENNKRILQRAMVAVTFFILAGIAWKLVHINPVFVNPPWPHHRQYQELAEAMAQGSVALAQQPDASLKQVENPYDTITLQAENIPYLMDYAYYKGQYYVYFGIVPELLFFLPYYLLTGGHLMNYQVIYAFYLLFVVGVFGLLWELFAFQEQTNRTEAMRKGKTVCYLVCVVAVCLLPNYVYILARPDLYHIPILSASAFLTLALWLALRAVRTEKKGYRIVLWIGAAFCGAAVAGCRPQFLLYEFLFPIILFWAKKKRRGKNVTKISEIFAILVPYLVVGSVVFWYNKVRFGSGFDFGATYSLTTNDMNHRGVSLARMLQGAFCFLLQPPNLQPVFPFVFKPVVHFGLMGKDLSEFTFGGMLVNTAFLWPVFLLPFLGRDREKGEKWIAWGLLLCTLFIAAFDANSAGVLQRYMTDAVWGLWVLAIFLWLWIWQYAGTENFRRVRRRSFLVAFVLTLLFSFFLLFADTDANALCYTAQVFYAAVKSCFF